MLILNGRTIFNNIVCPSQNFFFYFYISILSNILIKIILLYFGLA